MANENKIVTFNDLKNYTKTLGERITTDTNNLYRHTITLRGGNGLTKVVIDIYNSSVKNLTINKILDFIKDNYSYESSSAVGNNYCLSANGLAGENQATAENVIGIFYNLTNSCYSLITVGSGTSGGLTFKGYNCSEVTKMEETITKVVAVNSNPNEWSDDAPYTDSPQDTDTLSNVDLENTKVKKITFANLFTWILTKISGICEKGIQVSSGKIGHTNSITAGTKGSTTAIPKITYDAQGHITAVAEQTVYPPTTAGTNGQYWKSDGSGQGVWTTPSTSITSDSTNVQIPGAKAVYDICGAVTEETITFNSTYISANYSKVYKVGKVYMCNIAFQVKSDADVPANIWVIRLSSNVVKSGTEVYCVLHCTDLTNVPTTRLLQLGGSAHFHQFLVKTNPLPRNKYYFGNCIIVNNI